MFGEAFTLCTSLNKMDPVPTQISHGVKLWVWVSLLVRCVVVYPLPNLSSQSDLWVSSLAAGSWQGFHLFFRCSAGIPFPFLTAQFWGFWRDAAATQHPPGFLYSEGCHLLGCPKPLLTFTSCLPKYLGLVETKEIGGEIRKDSFLDS